MKCARCGKDAYASTTAEAIELGNGSLLIVRNIPCWKCRECDEIFYMGDVVERLEMITEQARRLVQEITVVDYGKAA